MAGEAFCGRLLLCADVHSCFNQTVSGYEATGTCRIIQGTSVTCGDWAY